MKKMRIEGKRIREAKKKKKCRRKMYTAKGGREVEYIYKIVIIIIKNK